MKKNKIINGFHLKIIAVITMFLDHFSFMIAGRWMNASYEISEAVYEANDFKSKVLIWGNQHQDLIVFFREPFWWIGRCAFPLFCFLLVEGFLHTKNRIQYAVRLFVFALLSEIPFDLSFNYEVLEPLNNNVMFTLLYGVLIMWILETAEKYLRPQSAEEKKSVKMIIYLLSVFCIILASVVGMSEVLSSDYGISGLAAILLIYIFRGRLILGYLLAVLSLVVINLSPVQLFALVTLIPISMYNGERGRNVKYFFYLFYPVHLLFLLVLRHLMGV